MENEFIKYTSVIALLFSIFSFWLSIRNRVERRGEELERKQLQAEELFNRIESAYDTAESAYRDYWRLAFESVGYLNEGYVGMSREFDLMKYVNLGVRDKIKTTDKSDINEFLKEIKKLEGKAIKFRGEHVENLRRLERDIERYRKNDGSMSKEQLKVAVEQIYKQNLFEQVDNNSNK